MAGPIISGGNPRLEALLFFALLVAIVVIGMPEFSSIVLHKLPWLAPLFNWLRPILEGN